MPDVPRGPSATAGERRRNLDRGIAGSGGLDGSSRWPKKPAERATVTAGSNVVVVIHGADGTVTRPTASIVMWVGAATPTNAVDYDLWYPSTI